MRDYEAMFILKPDLGEDKIQDLFNQIQEIITKNKAKFNSSNIWSEKRKLTFPIKRYKEGIYYLVKFNSDPQAIYKINHDCKLNEDILRVVFTKKLEREKK